MKSLLAFLSTLALGFTFKVNAMTMAKTEYTFTANCYISRCQGSSGCEISEKNQYELCVQRILLNMRQNHCEATFKNQTKETRDMASEKFLLVQGATFKSNCPVMSRASSQLCPDGRFSQNLNSDLKVCGLQSFK